MTAEREKGKNGSSKQQQQAFVVVVVVVVVGGYTFLFQFMYKR